MSVDLSSVRKKFHWCEGRYEKHEHFFRIILISYFIYRKMNYYMSNY